ncbi:chemotaxis protein, partial [Candidatus Endoriftia persephone str. Guaymas]|nr:chemotaxis protein [Candidatus Endoriftia persephone str. Guaymas]
MHKFLDRFSVGKKILIISLFFALALVGVVVYTVATLNQQKADSTVINIAGRQRMLTQKFTKELFDDLGRSRSEQSVRSTDKTKKLFEVSLAALRDGGETFSDLGMKKPLSLPPNQNEEIEAKLAVVANQWSALQVAAEKLRVLEPASPEFEKALARVRDL